MSLLQNSNAISEGGYNIANSLRFQSASTQYLSRTQTSGNRRTWTWSAWFKRGTLGVDQKIFGSGNGSTNLFGIGIGSGNLLEIFQVNTTTQFNWNSTQVLRDPSAWYHIVVVLDTTQATASNRLQVYLNGSLITANNGSYPSLNFDTWINFSGYEVDLGKAPAQNSIDGYLSEVNFIDGQALTPSSFGETDTLTGQWVAKKYTGTYGTNGFYLPFSNGTSTTTLGYDSSGNSNNWTLNNFTRSAGVSDCWVNDVPSGNGSSVGGTQPNSNYAVLSPIDKGTSLSTSFANLGFSITGTIVQTIRGTIFPTSGKWYFEATTTANTSSGNFMIGIATNSSNVNGRLGGDANSWGYSPAVTGGSYLWHNNVATSLGITDSVTGTYACAYDADNGKVWFRRPDGSWISGDPAAGTSPSYSSVAVGCSPSVAFASGSSVTVTAQINNGQRSFAYTPPSGFKALCTANLPAATIKKGNTVFDATLYTGNGSTQTITNAGGFSPDFVWLKSRSSGAQWHILEDTVRGAGTVLFSNSTAADQSYPTSITSFNSNGFSVGSDSTGGWNVSGSTMVAWQWDAGSSTVTNTSGTISSQVRANPTAGVSVVTWTPLAVAGTVGHGLGIAPSMVIIKQRNSADNWYVYHKSNGAGKYILLNTTAATVTNATVFSSTPTSSVFDAGTGNTTANYGAQVAYCFAEIAGFSKFGSYTGNGSTDGTFVYTGFRPKFVMWKRTDSAQNWSIEDSARSTSNPSELELFPNVANAEENNGSKIDFLSNGFKFRNTNANMNASGGTYIFACFAESPFQNSNAR